MVISASVKSVEGSEREKERLATSPVVREVMSVEREMEGGRVSIVRVRELSGSEPSALVLPAESENLDEATETTPLVVLLAVGVKVAVPVVAPAEIVMSDIVL